MWAQIEKNRDLRKDVRDNGRAAHPTVRNKGKEPIVPDDVDTLANEELSLGGSPSLSLSLAKDVRGSTKAKSCKRSSHHPAFSDAINGASNKARREASRGQNQPIRAPRNTSVLPEGMMPSVLPVSMMPPMLLVHPAFGSGPTFYMCSSDSKA